MGIPPNEERNAHILRLWMTGLSQRAIGEQYGISQQRVHEIVRDERAKIPKDDRESLIEREIMFLDHLRRTVMEIAESGAAPVTAGKDGDVVIDPETGEVVRDHTGRLAAINQARQTSVDLRKLLGLDSATKVEATTHITYSVEGMDPEALK